MALLVVLAALWAGAAALTRRCGARTELGRCRNLGQGWLVRCPAHPLHVVTLPDLGAAALALIGFLIVTHTRIGR